jgi:hypothetical protein
MQPASQHPEEDERSWGTSRRFFKCAAVRRENQARVAVPVYSATRRERIEAAVEAAGQRLAQPQEAWIAADPSRGGVRVLITGPPGLERTVAFAHDEAAATITERVRETIDD